MKPTYLDAIMLIYNYAVLLTGGWLVIQVGINDKWTLFSAVLIPAVVLTIYFRVGMAPRLKRYFLPADADIEEDPWWRFNW